MTAAVAVDNLGKAFRVHPTRLDKLARFATFGRVGRESLAWVLRGVSFEVAPGETIGIVGRNGAGKSTLLKIIAGTTQATEGSVAVRGRVAALLELGTGFHPELTGRQNAVMAGNLMGLSKAELGALMPSIEAFAEIGDYIERPLRVYSSGMQVRLAFSVATALRPEILIVDEALAVGDIRFQQKCFERIRDFRTAGTTIIFVTHDLTSIYRLCTRALWLDRGALMLDAAPKAVIDLYQASVLAETQRDGAPLRVIAPADADVAFGALAAPPPPDAAADVASGPSPVRHDSADARGWEAGSYDSPGVEIRSVRLLAEGDEEATVFTGNRRMTIEVAVRFAVALSDPHVGFQIRDRHGQAIFMTTTHGLGARMGPVRAGEQRTVRFDLKPMITPAQYTLTVGVANGARTDGSFDRSYVRRQDAAAFWVVDALDAIRWAGIANLNPGVTVAGDRYEKDGRAAGHEVRS